MLETPKRSTKRKRMGAGLPDLIQGDNSEQALEALEEYATQAEEALGVALSEAALKDRRIAALEEELRAQQTPQSTKPSLAKVELPTLSPTIGRAAQQTRQALDSVEQHTSAAGRALHELLLVAEEKEQCLQELEIQLNETQQELREEQQRSAAATQAAASSKDNQIEQLSQMRMTLEHELNEARHQLSGCESRIQSLETELSTAREASEAAERELLQLHDVLEHYVLRCRELERRHSSDQPSRNGGNAPQLLQPEATPRADAEPRSAQAESEASICLDPEAVPLA